MRIFLDANVLFSAALSDGAVRRMLTDLTGRGHRFVADGYVWEEARRNLSRYSPGALHWFSRLPDHVELHHRYAGAGVDVTSAPLPEKDLPVLASAVALECDHLVTGDKTHFGQFFGQDLLGVTIHSPRSLVAMVLGLSR